MTRPHPVGCGKWRRVGHGPAAAHSIVIEAYGPPSRGQKRLVIK